MDLFGKKKKARARVEVYKEIYRELSREERRTFLKFLQDKSDRRWFRDEAILERLTAGAEVERETMAAQLKIAGELLAKLSKISINVTRG